MRFLRLVAGLSVLAWGCNLFLDSDVPLESVQAPITHPVQAAPYNQVSPFGVSPSTDGLPLVTREVSKETSARSCQSVSMEGSHSAELLDDARLGALEDARDVCPSARFTATLGNCELKSAAGSDGNDLYRCRQQGVCEVCGDDLKRMSEVQS